MRVRTDQLLWVLLLSGLACGGGGGGGGSRACDVSSCGGCCTDNGVCEPGTRDAVCGRAGNRCESCGTGTCSDDGVCSRPGGNGGSGGSGGFGGGGTSGAGGGGTPSTYPACVTPDDCPNWFCECRSGPPVNSRHCINGRCEDGAQVCPGACAAFGTCWLGTAGGGFTGGRRTGPNTCTSGAGGGGGSTLSCTQTDLGRGCTTTSDCQSGLCFGDSPSFICTKICSTANDCPHGWSCEPSTGGSRVCMAGPLAGPTSTSTACTPATITDVGAACSTSCQGGFCVGISPQRCSRRCESDSDCPGTWRCTTGADFRYCAP